MAELSSRIKLPNGYNFEFNPDEVHYLSYGHLIVKLLLSYCSVSLFLVA
jgi:hypothetical protein